MPQNIISYFHSNTSIWKVPRIPKNEKGIPKMGKHWNKNNQSYNVKVELDLIIKYKKD